MENQSESGLRFLLRLLDELVNKKISKRVCHAGGIRSCSDRPRQPTLARSAGVQTAQSSETPTTIQPQDSTKSVRTRYYQPAHEQAIHPKGTPSASCIKSTLTHLTKQLRQNNIENKNPSGSPGAQSALTSPASGTLPICPDNFHPACR